MTPNVSLVIPTFNRRRFALRSMRFWSGRGVIVHVMDGSPEPISQSELAGLADNIRYQHRPVGICERLQLGAANTDTKYIALVGDDEYLVPSAVYACAAELDAERTLVSCFGRCLRFDVAAESVTARPAYPELANYSVWQDTGIERMQAHMNPYVVSSCYSVMRRDAWSKAMSLIGQRAFDDPGTSELQIELAAAYYGKSKVLNRLMWLRSSENDSVARTTTYRRFTEWWNDPADKGQRADFVAVTAAHLAEEGIDSRPDLDAAVEDALDAYLEGYRSGMRTRSQLSAVRRLLQRGSGLVGDSIKSRIKAALQKTKPLSKLYETPPRLFRDAVVDLQSTGVIVDISELDSIEQSILSAYGSASAA